MNSDLENIKKQWGSLGIDSHFKKVHHFSNPKFKTPSPDINTFYEYCRNKEVQGENEQTIKRALKVSSLLQKGHSIDCAIISAWTEFGLVSR